MVAAWSGRDDHLEFARIVLAENPADCGLEMTFLIEHRHDNRDAGPGCADSIPRGLHSIILFFWNCSRIARMDLPSSSSVAENKAPLLPPCTLLAPLAEAGAR